ncbi:hypothetical protein FEP92_00087 [Burkholderia multivorans]|nr:hypothetical protein [Burkholderia multivorans]MDR8859791.1 hypothetical protein [Burkholderia multivorans]
MRMRSSRPRALKIPARFVSGYVLADGAMQRVADAKQNAGGEREKALALQIGDGMQQVLGASHAGQSQSQSQGPAHAQAALDARPQPVALMQPPAGHAWAEAHVDGLGWVGFDPFMNRCPDERYVRIAVGLDCRDAQPVTGIGAIAVGVDISVAQSPELV